MGALVVWWFFLSEMTILQQILIIAIYTLISIYACHRVCRDFAVKDAGEMVADEVIGMWIAMLAMPQSLWLALLGFALFRFLDIRKPWLIGKIDVSVDGGLGVILDDILAGIVTAVCLWSLLIVIRALGISAL